MSILDALRGLLASEIEAVTFDDPAQFLNYRPKPQYSSRDLGRRDAGAQWDSTAEAVVSLREPK